MVKRRFSLKAIYLAVLTVVFSLSSVAFVLFDMNSQQQQTEAALLEEARTFAREMDAVWTFMDNSQDVINSTSDGAYSSKVFTAPWWARAWGVCSQWEATTPFATRTSTREANRTSPTSSSPLP